VRWNFFCGDTGVNIIVSDYIYRINKIQSNLYIPILLFCIGISNYRFIKKILYTDIIISNMINIGINILIYINMWFYSAFIIFKRFINKIASIMYYIRNQK
jgi:hypothetical protein